MQLLNFQHIETETADQTIQRFEAIVDLCGQQGVAPSELLQQRMLLSRPNARYTYLKKYVQHSDTPTNIQKLFRKMRDDDTDHQVDLTPLPGSADFLEAVNSQVEIMWAQKLSKEGKNPRGGGGGGYKSDSICYNCGQKGHFSKQCTLDMKICNRHGHLEPQCRTTLQIQRGQATRQQEERGQAAQQVQVDQQGQAARQQYPANPPPSPFYNTGEAIMAMIDTASTKDIWLGDSGASHHTTHDMANYSTFSKLATPYKIAQVQGEVLVTHSGSVTLTTQSATGSHTVLLHDVLLHDVLYIPSMSFSLLSLQKMVDAVNIIITLWNN